MEVEQSYRDQLTVLAGELKTHRDDSGIANDVYEYVDDLRSLAELMLETKPSRMNFDIPAHANTIERWAAKLRAHYGAEIDAQTDYRRAFEVGAAFLAVAKARPTPPDGYLGSDRIVRETFAFLQSDYAMHPLEDPGTGWEYGSNETVVHLDLPKKSYSSCDIRRARDRNRSYSLEELMFMGGKSVSLGLPPDTTIATEADVQAWFTTVASILRQYGADVLANRPGAWDCLAAAAAERERLYIAECERLHAASVADEDREGRPAPG